MTTMATTGMLLEAPAPEGWPATLLDTFTPRDGRLEPDDLYVSLNCIGLPDSKQLCDTDTAWADSDYQDGQLIDGIRFVSDIGIKCRALGWGDLDTQFNRVVELRESASVEQNLMALRFTGTQGGAAATNITPAGGAVTPAQGVALLEGHAAMNYAGKPAIHSPVSVASLLLDVAIGYHADGNKLLTSLGSDFIVGAGYEQNLGPSGAAPAAGEKWLYASGGIDIVRGRRVQLDTVFSRLNNYSYLRSQRIYVVSVDCYISAVRVKLYG